MFVSASIVERRATSPRFIALYPGGSDAFEDLEPVVLDIGIPEHELPKLGQRASASPAAPIA